MTGSDLACLAGAAAAGQAQAWDALVGRFAGLVWAVARGHGLSPVDAADVSQTTWLRLAEHLPRIREPERLGAWLATTARHESIGLLRRAERQVPVDPTCGPCALDTVLAAPDVDRELLDQERDEALWRAFESLSSPCKVLLRTLLADPAPSYAEVSEALGVPMGSIGPTRKRCLGRLRRCVGVVVIRGEHTNADSERRAAG